MNLIEAFLRNPVKVSVGVLMVALFGTIALMRMPMQLTPEVQTPVLSIRTIWPGASPQEIEREIVQEQEEQLKGVEGVTKMTSSSTDSSGTITLEFAVGTDMSEALLKVNTRLQQVPQYPVDANEPVIVASNSSDRPIAWFIMSQRNPDDELLERFQREHPEFEADIERIRSIEKQNPGLAALRLRILANEHPEVKEVLPEEIDVPKLRKFAEDVIEARFERVAGVSNANVFGGREEELQVVLDPRKLASRELTIGDVRSALMGHNKDTSGGDFWQGKRRYVVRTLGQFRSPEQVEGVILARRDGAPVYVRDVAEVRLGHKKPGGLVRRFGTSSIAINAQRSTGANVLAVMEGLKEAMAELDAGIIRQRGLKLTQVYDETEYILSAVDLVRRNIYIGGLLTISVLLLFLRSGRSTLVIALAIPTSVLGAFICLGVLGRSLNVVSLAGLAFAIGMLVDNAVVVLENVYRHYQRGEDRFVAATRGTQEVWGAVLASTLTTLAVFIPVLFVQEEAGQLFRDIALAISAGVGLSLIVSVSVIPTAAAKVLAPRSGGDVGDTSESAAAPGRQPVLFRRLMLDPTAAFGRWVVRVVVGVNLWLQRGLAVRLAGVFVLVGSAIALSFLLMPAVEYLPGGNRNLVIGILLPPPGLNLDELMGIGEGLETRLQPYWDVDMSDPSSWPTDYPVIDDFFYVASGRTIFMGLRAADPMRASELVPLIRRAAGGIPGTFAVAQQSSLFDQSFSGGRTIDVEITGPDLRKLIALGGRIMGQVHGLIPGVQARPIPSLDLSSPEVHIEPKWEQCADMHINAAELGYAVDALVDGAYAGDYFRGSDKIDLTIMGQESLVSRMDSIDTLPVTTPSGHLVSLAALANVRLSSGPEQINHRERQRAVTIRVSPPDEIPLEEAMELITGRIVAPLRESGELGSEYQIMLAGTADKLRATWRALRFNIILALMITYLLMAALFESWLYPFVIILSVPLGAVGAFAGLALLNVFVFQALDVLTMLGFVILIGTVVNNPILIVHQSLNHMRNEGMSPRDAIIESVRTRVRPIFMTTITTVFGLAPLVFFPGPGSELYRGLGSVVIGGLLVSTIFTLFLVPTLFSLTMEAKEGLLRMLGRGPTEQARKAIATKPRERDTALVS